MVREKNWSIPLGFARLSRRLNEIVLLQIRLQDGVLHRRKHESDVLRICGTEESGIS